MDQENIQTMTIKELAEVAGCSIKTVRRVIKDTYPGLTINGKIAKLTKEQCFDIMSKLPKRNDLGQNLGQMSKVALANVQGSIQENNERIGKLEDAIAKLIEITGSMAKQIQASHQKALPPKTQEKKKITFADFKRICLGLESRYKGKETFSVTLFRDRTKRFLEINGMDRDDSIRYKEVIHSNDLAEKFISHMEALL